MLMLHHGRFEGVPRALACALEVTTSSSGVRWLSRRGSRRAALSSAAACNHGRRGHGECRSRCRGSGGRYGERWRRGLGYSWSTRRRGRRRRSRRAGARRRSRRVPRPSVTTRPANRDFLRQSSHLSSGPERFFGPLLFGAAGADGGCAASTSPTPSAASPARARVGGHQEARVGCAGAGF